MSPFQYYLMKSSAECISWNKEKSFPLGILQGFIHRESTYALGIHCHDEALALARTVTLSGVSASGCLGIARC